MSGRRERERERVRVAVDGGELAVWRLGSPEAPPVLAVHGITANSHGWLAVARALGGRASLIAVDLRGRADSRELPAPYGTAAYVADLVAVIDAFDLGPALITGHSLGAYIAARLAVEAPDRVQELVLVDGGLTIPQTGEVKDPQAFIEAFLGPSLARLAMRFASAEAYHEWWRAHPAFAAASDVNDDDLLAYADHDVIGAPPELRSSVLQAAIRADAAELDGLGTWARELSHPATLLAAPRGLLDEPRPMQPVELVAGWAGERANRSWQLVEDVNHFTIAMGARGAAAVADAIVSRVGR